MLLEGTADSGQAKGTFIDLGSAPELICYGLDEMRAVKAEQLMKIYPDIKLEDLQRLRHIQFLISHREGELAPQRERVVGSLVLSDSPLGRTVGGAHPDLHETVKMAFHNSRTLFCAFNESYSSKVQRSS